MSLTKLHLVFNAIGDVGCAALAEAMKGGHLASLTKLDLGSNSVGEAGCADVP